MNDLLKHVAVDVLIHTAIKKVFATDIDSTLIENDPKYQATVSKKTGARYSAEQWAKIEDRYSRMDEWNFSEWEDLNKNIDSIRDNKEISRNVIRLKNAYQEGMDIAYITSRGGGQNDIEEHITSALEDRFQIPITHAYALGDYNKYGKDKLPIKKKRALEELVAKYGRGNVVFMDDEDANLTLARDIEGVIVIDARE